MWLPLLFTLLLSILVSGQDLHANQDLYDYSFSIDSNALDGLRRPDGHHNEDIVCEEGKDVHIDGVWFGYQDYQKIPLCHQDKPQQDCLYDLTNLTLDCHKFTCKFPELSQLPTKDDIPPRCRAGLRYWHVCYTCLSHETELVEASEDDPSQYQDYYYYDYDYEAPQTTYRFDVEGNEDLTCENDQHHLVVESAKYGFDKEAIKSHMFEDGDSECVFDFTNEVVQKLCSSTQCKSPMLKDLKKYNVGKKCKEKALLGMWEIIYTCKENQDANLQYIVENQDNLDAVAPENKDSIYSADVEKDEYLYPEEDENEEKLDPAEIENGEKLDSVSSENQNNMESVVAEKDEYLYPVEVESEEKLHPEENKNEEELKSVKIEYKNELVPMEVKSKDIQEPAEVQHKEKLEPVEVENKVKMDPVETESEDKLDHMEARNEYKLDQIEVENEDKLDVAANENEDNMDSAGIEKDNYLNPVVVESEAKLDPVEAEREEKLDQLEEENEEKLDPVDIEYNDNLVPKKVENKDIRELVEVQYKDKLEPAEIKNKDKLNLIEIKSEDKLDQIEARNEYKLDQVEVENKDKLDQKEIEYEIKLESEEVKHKEKFEPIKDNIENKQEPKQIENIDKVNLVKVESKDNFKSEEIENKDKLHVVDVDNEDKLEPKEVENEDKLNKKGDSYQDKLESEKLERGDNLKPVKVKIEDKLEPEKIENEDRQDPTMVKTEDKVELEEVENEHKLDPVKVVSKHVLDIKQNLPPVTPTIATVLSIVINDKLGLTSNKPMTVQTKTAKQNLLSLQGKITINLPITAEPPLTTDKKSSDGISNDTTPYEEINTKATTESELNIEPDTKPSSSDMKFTTEILMKESTSSTLKPQVVNMAVQKQVSENIYDIPIETTIGTTKYSNKFQQTSPKSAAEPTEAMKQYIGNNIRNEKNIPMHRQEFQLHTTEIPIINHSGGSLNTRHQVGIDKITDKKIEITLGTTEIYQKVHQAPIEITTESINVFNIQINNESIMKKEEHIDVSKGVFEPREATKIQQYSGIMYEDPIILKSSDNVEKDVKNIRDNNGILKDDQQDNIKNQDPKQINEKSAVRPTHKVPTLQRNDQQGHKQIVLKSDVHPTSILPIQQKNDQHDHKQIDLESVIHATPIVPNKQKNDQQDYRQVDSKYVVHTRQMVPPKPKDGEQLDQKNVHRPIPIVTLEPKDYQQNVIQKDPKFVVFTTQISPSEQQDDYIKVEPKSVAHTTQREPIEQKNDQQGHIQTDPISIIHTTQILPLEQKADQKGHIQTDPISIVHTTQIVPLEPKADKKGNLQADPKPFLYTTQIVPTEEKNYHKEQIQKEPLSTESATLKNINRFKDSLKHRVIGNKEVAVDNRNKLMTPLISLEDQTPTNVFSDSKIQTSQNINLMEKYKTKHDLIKNKHLSRIQLPNFKGDNSKTMMTSKKGGISSTITNNIIIVTPQTLSKQPILSSDFDINEKAIIDQKSSQSQSTRKKTKLNILPKLSENKLSTVTARPSLAPNSGLINQIDIELNEMGQDILHDLSKQNLTVSHPTTAKTPFNKAINNTSNEILQSSTREKNNPVKIHQIVLNQNLSKNDKEIGKDSPNSNINKLNLGPIHQTSTQHQKAITPVTVYSSIPNRSTTTILPTNTPNIIQEKIPTTSTMSGLTIEKIIPTTDSKKDLPITTSVTPTQNLSAAKEGNNIISDPPIVKAATKNSTHPTTIQNVVTTTSKPDIKPADRKDFISSTSTSPLPSKQKNSAPVSSSFEDKYNQKQYNFNEHFNHKNVAKNTSPQLKGDVQLQEKEDPRVKVSWFSTTPDEFNQETEIATQEMTTGLYTEIDLIVGDLLNGDKDISFDQKNLLTSNVRIDEVEILHFVEETEREILSDIDHLKHDLDNLLVLDDSMKDFPEVVQEVAKERVESFLISMSESLKKVKLGNILKGPIASSQITDDSKPSQETTTAANLLNATVDISEKLSKTLEIGSEIDIDLPDIAMTVRKKSLSTNSSNRWESKLVEVNLPDQESIAGEDSTITVSFTAYNNLGTMMALNENFSSSVLSINVIGVEGGKQSIQLTKPLQFKLAHNTLTQDKQRNCVYWDFANSLWSEGGCSAVISTSSVNSTTCECDHLTNFAILVDMHGLAVHEDHKPFLDILTNIGCLISMTGLILCILVYSTFRSAKNERSTININLCMCLLLSELIFMFGIGQTHSPTLCAVISAILHYIFLASFFWMLIAGFQIYVLLVEVFEVDGSRFVHYYLLGYIAPLIIVLFSLLFDTLINPVSVYGTENYCWMDYGLHLGISFLCPLSVIMTANVYFLIVAFHKFHVHSMDMIRLKSKKSSIKTYLNGLFGLLFLLGGSWSIGLVCLIYPSIILSYIFTILNSLQGFFIFFFNCVGNNKIRTEGSRKIREAMACIFNINLRRRLSRNSSTMSDTKTTDVKEYFMPDNQYCVNYSEGDKRQYRRLPQVARDLTYYY